MPRVSSFYVNCGCEKMSESNEESPPIDEDDISSFADDWRQLDSKIEQVKLEMDFLIDRVTKQKHRFATDMSRKLTLSRFKGYNEAELYEFLDTPYAILPRGSAHPNEWWVVTPKFTNYELGYLDHSANGWHYFLVNKYMSWLARIPEEIRDKFKFRKPLPLRVYDGMLLTGEDAQEETWNRYRKHLTQIKGKDRIKIRTGHEFSLIAEIIDDGMLPFTPQPVEEEDIRVSQIGFDLRDYQEIWWKEFLKWGAVGVFAPFGSGKTFIGMHAIASLEGQKLVVVPTRGLTDQWEERIKFYLDDPGSFDVVTYHAYKKIRSKEYVLAIYDECHRLPANQFARMSTIRAKYRIGLSGTPYREDGRTNYIFALTGQPLALAWEQFFELDIVNKPTITLYLFSHFRYKERKLAELIAQPKKTIIFVWRIKVGKKLQKEHGLPFVYGATPGSERLEIIRNSEQVIVSSVGSEGISIPDLERVIEYDWLGKSRREEAQRFGRLFHSKEKDPEHIILMTDGEFEKDETRLYSAYEKGFRINVIR